MSGKLTYLEVHKSRKGGFVTAVNIENHDWKRIEGVVGRSLSADEQYSITRALTDIAGMKDAASNLNVINQTTIENLKGIGKLVNEKVLKALNDCDSTTKALIEQELLSMHSNPKDGEFKQLTGLTPSMIKGAAKCAVDNLKPAKGGPKVLGYRLIFKNRVLQLWESLGRTDNAVWEIEGKTTPLVQFSTALLELIDTENSPSFSTVAQLLRKDADKALEG
jgi:hypothetical protein